MERVLFHIGVDFRDCAAAVRDSARVTSDELPSLLTAVRAAVPGLDELVVLSTCNRTELYASGDSGAAEALGRRFAAERGIGESIPWRKLQERAAAEHLFRVACGLESAVLGDAQIVGQVRAAHLAACSSSTAGPVLHRAFQSALRVSRRVRRTTGLGQGEASLGAAVTSVVRDLGPIRGALVLGAGDAARDVCLHLSKRLAIPLRIANRSAERAEELAGLCRADVVPWENVLATLADVDVVIAATAAPGPVLTTAVLLEASRSRTRPLAVVDVGVPRNSEPAAGVIRIDLDAIVARQEKALAGRRTALPAAEAMVAEEVGSWEAVDAQRGREESLKLLFRETDGACDALFEELDGRMPSAAVERMRSRLASVLGRHACRLRGRRPRTVLQEVAG